MKVGERVRLTHTLDSTTDIEPGDEGTVEHVTETGALLIDWDRYTPHRLVLIEGYDKWEVIESG